MKKITIYGTSVAKFRSSEKSWGFYTYCEQLKNYFSDCIINWRGVNQCSLERLYLDIKKEFPFFEFQVYEFINNIEVYYQRSKILISRAGASTISESLHFNLPSIYVPIKNSSGDHQFLNAEEVSSNELGLMSVEKELSDVFLNKIHNLLYNQTIRDTILKAMRKNAEVRNSDSAENIIEGILEDVR